MVLRDFAPKPPSSSLRRVLLFQRIYFPLLVLRDPLWPRGTVGWGDWCQGGYEPLTRKVCSSKCGPWWHKAPRILASFGCSDLLSSFTTAAKLLTAWSLWWSKGLWAQTGPWLGPTNREHPEKAGKPLPPSCMGREVAWSIYPLSCMQCSTFWKMWTMCRYYLHKQMRAICLVPEDRPLLATLDWLLFLFFVFFF